MLKLFQDVIEGLSPTYEIDVRSIRQLCNLDTGINQFQALETQNQLLRRMMSTAPNERVPRHRLIRNLIESGEFEKAATEIRIFETDFRTEGPIAKYKISLLVARALRSPGLQDSDRSKILDDARRSAERACVRFKQNKYVFYVYCDVGLALMYHDKESDTFQTAMECLRRAEERLGDPDVTKKIKKYEREAAVTSYRLDLELED